MEDALNKARAERNSLVKEALIIRKYHAGELTEKKAMNQLHALYKDKDEELRPTAVPSEARLGVIKLEKQCCVVKIASLKEQLLQLLKRHTGVRELRPEELSVQHIVSVFDSALTRALKMDINGLYNDIIIVKTYFFDVFKNIVEDGFTYQGDRYVLLTASAGQIRTKKSVFIKEKRLQEVQDVISCGLSVDDINAHGGVNVNKYLAYLALSNSATDVIPWFDVDRCIVVDDLETTVTSMVDFVDEKTYTVHRQEMSFPITHTDGCGMILPSASKKNFMIRLPWIKGLLAVFPFDKFINQVNMYKNDGNSAKIKDIYGKTHDILAENINIIFTKSQFKMWKYYSSWDEYKEKFKRFGCTAGMCNEEDDKIQDAKINYQMLQTLTDLREDELEHIVGKTAYKISSISSDRETMLRVFGATTKNQHKNYFQQCLLLYPELLQDEYCRDMLRSIKGSLEKEAWSGRVDVYGKYTFVVPDMFAFCQHLFCGEATPTGLLKNGEVYCRLFRAPELDCLRSPHLYREHAIRTNVAPEKQEMAEWFCTDAIYTSIEDNISKILMFDCDGDKLLVCADKVLVQAAKRNMEGIVPLYYEMAKAGSMPLTPTVMYNGMIAAYTGGNIGQISNDITKVWNNPEPDLEVIKLLCMENNFTIDYAKTLYKPARPLEAEKRITEATRRQLPHYFIWAKDKREDQVAPPGTGCVDKILDMIPKGRLRFDQKKNGKLNYHLLMQNWRLDMEEEKAKEVLSTYKDAVADIGTVMYFSEDQQDNSNYILGQLRDKLTAIAPMEYVTDVLVKHLFHQKHTPRKVVFWNLCGEQVLKNLQANISTKTFYCVSCGKRVVRRHPNQTRCDQCAADRRKAYNAEKQREYRRKKRESCTPLSQ